MQGVEKVFKAYFLGTSGLYRWIDRWTWETKDPGLLHTVYITQAMLAYT